MRTDPSGRREEALQTGLLFVGKKGKDKMENYQITQWCRRFIREQVSEGDYCIDATCGNGHDTLLLCELAGRKGMTAGFDIQRQALEKTRERLKEAGVEERAELFGCGHEKMKEALAGSERCRGMLEKTEDGYGSVSCVVFNFGYLPGGSHDIATRAETSLEALRQGMDLLKKGGIISLCIYSGKDSGFEEKDAVMEYLKTLDSKKYLVIMSSYYNRPNHPPVPGLVIRL